METKRDQLFVIMNQLDFIDIKNLCQSNNYYRQICQEDRFGKLITRKYKKHQERVERYTDDFLQKIDHMNKLGKLICNLSNNHTITFHKFPEIFIEETGTGLPLNEYMLNGVFLAETGINLDKLFKLSNEELIDVLTFILRDPYSRGSSLNPILGKMQKSPHEFDYDNIISTLSYKVGFTISLEGIHGSTETIITLSKASNEQVKFIGRHIFNKYSNPVMNMNNNHPALNNQQ